MKRKKIINKVGYNFDLIIIWAHTQPPPLFLKFNINFDSRKSSSGLILVNLIYSLWILPKLNYFSVSISLIHKHQIIIIMIAIILLQYKQYIFHKYLWRTAVFVKEIHWGIIINRKSVGISYEYLTQYKVRPCSSNCTGKSFNRTIWYSLENIPSFWQMV